MEISRNNYHKDVSRISKSGLDAINDSPLHYWDKYLNPDAPDRDQKKFFDFGDVANDLLLIPEQFNALYAITPPDAPGPPTKAQLNAARPSRETIATISYWNNFRAENYGKTIVTASDWELAQRIRDAVQKHPPAAELLKQGFAEQTYLFQEPITGAMCKIRPDWTATDARILVDFKTSKNASARAFGRSALDYRYHVQGAFYYDGFMYNTGQQFDGFMFIVAEKTRPFPVKVYFMDDDDLQLGRAAYLRNCQTYVDCKKNNIWPGYGNRPERIKLPNFAFSNL